MLGDCWMQLQKFSPFGAYTQKALNYSFLFTLQRNNTTFTVIAMVAAMALLGVVVITLVTIPLRMQQAEAAGCNNGIAFNASKGRCFGH
jgi:hypothetical protein